MADDLSDVYAELRKLQEQVRVLMSANPLEKSSVTNGQIRIIGGTIRVDGGGNLIVNGTMSVNGTSTVTGSFTVSGPWKLSGAGEITGNVVITGNINSTGTLTQNGPWNMNGAGNIAGNVTQTGNTDMTGNFTVGANGKITVGSMVIDPTNGGSVTFPGGAVVRASAGGGVAVVQGSYSAVITSAGASVGKAGLNLSVTDAVGFQFVGLTTITQSASGGLPVGSMYLTATNQPRRVVSG